MDSLRLVCIDEVCSSTPCCRCGTTEGRWDQIAGKSYCPRCEEALVVGDAPPLVERTEKKPCSVCNHQGTLRFLSFPVRATHPVEIDLCPEHFRALLARRLGPFAYQHICRRLDGVGLGPDQIFLLHDAFYDPQGRALQPAFEIE